MLEPSQVKVKDYVCLLVMRKHWALTFDISVNDLVLVEIGKATE